MAMFRCELTAKETSYWSKFDSVIRRTTDRYSEIDKFRTAVFYIIPDDVVNIVVHNYSNNYVVLFLREGETITYPSGSGNAPYPSTVYRTGVLTSLTDNQRIPVNYTTSNSGSIGRDPTSDMPVMNTCDLLDENGDVVYPRNCRMSDFLYEIATSAITGWEIADAEGRIRFSYSNTYAGTSAATYGILFYRDGELDADMTIGDGKSTNIVKTAAEDTIVARDIGNGIYVRSYITVGGVTIYGKQIFTFWGVSEITSYERYDSQGRIMFYYSNSILYSGSYAITYGVLIYNYGDYGSDMVIDSESVYNTILNNSSGKFQTRDVDLEGVSVRPYILINGFYLYGTQVYVKWSDLPPIT